MPFDREGTLRNAEKLLRQGKLDLAIAEYRKVIEDQPSDWNTANTLGDLYFRAGQLDKAIAQYNDIAAHLANEGFFPKAVALYKKILKIKPDEERAMWHLGNISARQGLLVEARSNFVLLAERRRARGDAKGVAEVRIRLGDLDGADLETRLAGVRARVELGDPKAAVDRLKQDAADLQEKGKDADSLEMLTEAAQIDPEDMSLRQMLVQAYIARGDFDAACQFATSAAELRQLATQLFGLGREDEGLNVLASAADADPADASIRMELVKRLVARGDVASARTMLTPEVAGNDPELLWLLAEMELRDGHIPEGTALLAENARRRSQPPRRAGHPRVFDRRSQPRCGVRVHRSGGRNRDCRRRVGLGRCRAQRVRQPRAESHSRADAAGGDLRRRRARSDDAQRAGPTG